MNQNTPACRLPPELLSEIFILVVRNEIQEYHEAAQEARTFFVNSPLRLSWVCNYFRAIAQNTPQCWTFTQLDATKSTQSRLNYFTSRWKQIPGTVVAENVKFHGASKRYALIPVFPTNMVEEYMYYERAGERASWSPLELPTATKVVVHLQHIREKSVRSGDWSQSFRSNSSAPVRVAEIYNCILNNLPKTLEELKWSVRAPLRELQFAIVGSLPKLRRLHLCHMTFICPVQAPVLHNLTHLIMDNMSSQLLRHLPERLLPALCHLGLFDFAFADDGLELFIRRFSSQLSSLDIVGPPALQSSEWRPLLSAATNVLELTIGIRGPKNVISNKNFLEALLDLAGLPKLVKLSIHGQRPYLPQAAYQDQIQAIVRARQVLLV